VAVMMSMAVMIGPTIMVGGIVAPRPGKI